MKMVKPQYTILTGINSQHLKTFKSEENIRREKCRILDVEDGVCVINAELKNITESVLLSKKVIPETIYAGIDENSDIYAKICPSTAKEASSISS